jgi:DNA-binding IscR family transcriptional regulator
MIQVGRRDAMKLTLSSEMGIHAVWYLATLDNAEPVLSADVARGISVSESYSKSWSRPVF